MTAEAVESAGSVTAGEVRRIAELARLHPSEEEVARLAVEMSGILGHIAQLNELDAGDVAPLHHVLDLTNALRDDEPGASLPVERVLANAPARKGDFFLTPKVIKDESA